MRAVSKGIGHQQFIPRPSSGESCKGAETKFLNLPKAIPKKSPIGHSTEGSVSPSPHILMIACLGKRSSPPTVIQMCLMQPGDEVSSTVAAELGAIVHQSRLPPVTS